MRLMGAILVLAAACGGAPTALDPPKVASIERVPIPRSATQDQSLTSASDVGYRVPGASFRDLTDWYDRQMPEGQTFGRWQWCDGVGEGEHYWKIYNRQSEWLDRWHAPIDQVLIVTVSAGSQPAILIGSTVTTSAMLRCLLSPSD
jgi:hypothetical protein